MEIILSEPKRQKLDDGFDEKLGENANTKRLTQLKKDIAVLEAAVRRGQETMEKMLHIAEEDMKIDPLVIIQVNKNLVSVTYLIYVILNL